MRVFVAATCLVLCTIVVAQNGGAQGKKKKDTDLGPAKKEDVPKYINMLTKAQDASTRAAGAEMLGKRGSIQVNDVKDAIPLLQKSATKDIDSKVRRAAVDALGEIATDPEGSVPILTEAMKDKALEVQLAAIASLGAYGPEARSALTELKNFQKTWTDKKDDKQFKNIMKLVSDTRNKILATPKKNN